MTGPIKAANDYRRARYRTDPEYRRRKLRAVKSSHERAKADPVYCRLAATRKRVYNVRESYEQHRQQAERLFARLEALIARTRDGNTNSV